MAQALGGKTFFGHPRGLMTLFFTELWERFSYYGMRGLLVLFMTDAVRGGMGMDKPRATAIYGLYTFGVYAMALPGGWLADRLFGQRRSVLYGGVIIALGHYTLAIPADWAFYSGLCLVVLGTGLLKPNVSAIVGELYPEGGARRDAGFSIFYMGINVGAFLGPLVCGWLGEQRNWHLGFAAAGVGMTLALIQYVAGARHLGSAGHVTEEAASPSARAEAKRLISYAVLGLLAAALGVYALNSSGAAISLGSYQILPLTLLAFAQMTGVILVLVSVLYFGYTIVFACRDSIERRRVGLIALLFLGAALFWSGFEQAGSSMNFFADESTNRLVGDWEAPASWLQSINPLFIILLAPVVGMIWIWLGSRNPSIPFKFGTGLCLLGLGFFVMAWGAAFVTGGVKVSPMWLIVTYFFHTVGELCLSPVGLSSVTKLAPARLVSQMMGTWFLGSALGNLVAGLVAGYIEAMPQSELFGTVAIFGAAAGLLFLVLARPIRALAVGVN